MTAIEFQVPQFLQRLLAVLLSLAVIWLTVSLLVSIAEDSFAHHLRLALLTHEQWAEEQLVSRTPARDAQIDRLTMKLSDPGLLFTKAEASVVATQIQAQVATAVSGSGARLEQNTSEIVARKNDPLVHALVHVSFQSDIAQLTRILAVLESAHPTLFVEHLSVHDPDAPNGPIPSEEGPNQLQVELAIVGYVRPS